MVGEFRAEARTVLDSNEYEALCKAAKDSSSGNGAKVSSHYLRLTNEKGQKVLKYEKAGGVVGFFKRLFSNEYNLATIAEHLSTKKIVPKENQEAPGVVLSWFNSKVEKHNTKKKDSIQPLILRNMYVPAASPKAEKNFSVQSIAAAPLRVDDAAAQAVAGIGSDRLQATSPKAKIMPPGGAHVNEAISEEAPRTPEIAVKTPRPQTPKSAPQSPKNEVEAPPSPILPLSEDVAAPPGGLHAGVARKLAEEALHAKLSPPAQKPASPKGASAEKAPAAAEPEAAKELVLQDLSIDEFIAQVLQENVELEKCAAEVDRRPADQAVKLFRALPLVAGLTLYRELQKNAEVFEKHIVDHYNAIGKEDPEKAAALQARGIQQAVLPSYMKSLQDIHNMEERRNILETIKYANSGNYARFTETKNPIFHQKFEKLKEIQAQLLTAPLIARIQQPNAALDTIAPGVDQLTSEQAIKVFEALPVERQLELYVHLDRHASTYKDYMVKQVIDRSEFGVPNRTPKQRADDISTTTQLRLALINVAASMKRNGTPEGGVAAQKIDQIKVAIENDKTNRQQKAMPQLPEAHAALEPLRARIVQHRAAITEEIAAEVDKLQPDQAVALFDGLLPATAAELYTELKAHKATYEAHFIEKQRALGKAGPANRAPLEKAKDQAKANELMSGLREVVSKKRHMYLEGQNPAIKAKIDDIEKLLKEAKKAQSS